MIDSTRLLSDRMDRCPRQTCRQHRPTRTFLGIETSRDPPRTSLLPDRQNRATPRGRHRHGLAERYGGDLLPTVGGSRSRPSRRCAAMTTVNDLTAAQSPRWQHNCSASNIRARRQPTELGMEEGRTLMSTPTIDCVDRSHDTIVDTSMRRQDACRMNTSLHGRRLHRADSTDRRRRSGSASSACQSA